MSFVDRQHPVRWRGTGVTDVGKVRHTNQDAFTVDNQLGLWIIADGMGGRAGGNIASRLAVESVRGHLQRTLALQQSSPGTPEEMASLLRDAIAASDQVIRTKALAQPGLNGMGTTIVALHIHQGPPPTVALAHVGDSRAYLLRAKQLLPLTRDHSVMEDFLSRGLISRKQALTHPQRHVLTRALGIEGQADPDVSTCPLDPDDLILLCTDGVTKMLDDAEILHTLLCANGSAEAACKGLIQAANQRGGKDNITVVVVHQSWDE